MTVKVTVREEDTNDYYGSRKGETYRLMIIALGVSSRVYKSEKRFSLYTSQGRLLSTYFTGDKALIDRSATPCEVSVVGVRSLGSSGL